MRGGALLRIARWEVTSGAGGLDRRAIALAAAATLLLGALLPMVVGGAVAPDEGIYRAGVAEESPYYEPLADDPRFDVSAPVPGAVEAGRADLQIRGNTLVAAEDAKGRAAAATFGEAIESYNDRLMRTESDQVAAFPVSVQLRYVERDLELVRQGDTGSGDGGFGTDGDDGVDGDGSADDGSAESGDGASDESSGTGAGGGGLSNLAGGGFLTGQTSGSPSDISPPFPFVSLVLAFAFVVPMNFVIQAYASSILHERTNRRGELLLIAPVSPATIVAGKTLPYFAVMVLIAAATALAIGGGPVSLVAVIPVAMLFLACAFVGALLARSHKELTFVLVTVSVLVTTYVFVPAIFTQVHPIAAISPLTLVVRDLEGAAVSAGTAAFSTVPVTVVASTLFALGLGLYREEDLFAQLPVPSKLLDALANPISGPKSAALLSALSVPFVFVGELLAVAVLFVLPLGVGLPVLIVCIAAIEEVAKSLHVYAGFARARYARGLRSAAVVGAASGTGFFLAEKLAVVVQVVGLSELDLGRAAFQLGAGTGGSASPLVLAGLFLAPLALHVVTAGISAAGASRSRRAYAGGLAIAVVVHAAYNLTVVSAVGNF